MNLKTHKKKNKTSKISNNNHDNSFNAVGIILLTVSFLFIALPLIYLSFLVYLGRQGDDAVGLGALFLEPLFLFGIFVAITNIIFFGFIDNKLLHGSVFTTKKIIVYLSAVFVVISFIIFFVIPSGIRDVIYLFNSDDEVQQPQFSEQQNSLTQEVTTEEVRNLISSCSISSIIFLGSNGTVYGVDLNLVQTGHLLVSENNENSKTLYVAEKFSEPTKSIFEEFREKCPYINFYDYTM